MLTSLQSALSKFENWLGTYPGLSPELFQVSDIVRNLCELDGVDVHALSGEYGARMYFSKEGHGDMDHWLWMFSVKPDGLIIRIRAEAPKTEGKVFLASLLSSTYALRDAMQMIDWWNKSEAVLPVAISTYVALDPEVLLDVFTQLDLATREGMGV